MHMCNADVVGTDTGLALALQVLCYMLQNIT